MAEQHRAEIEFYGHERVQEMARHARKSAEYEWQISLIDPKLFAGRQILEIGCGAGKYGFLLAKQHPQSRIIATDLVPALVTEARRIRTSENLTFRVADAENLPFQDFSFDVVFGGFVLHHLPRLEAALREIRRVLAPRGRYIGFEPNGLNLYIYLIHRLGIGKSSNEKPIFPRHVQAGFSRMGFDVGVDFFFPRFNSFGNSKYIASCFLIDAVKRG